ncbi:MAG TPA: tetratricopeptide repeat protein [Candidatus Bathyarchaeia archaeon]|nr:tetratricopeptide repeat protein [Candidatus Bathyarchaeia archaeon]
MKYFLAKKRLGAGLLLVGIVFLLYFPSLRNSFVWDDHFVIVQNDFVKSWTNVPLLFQKKYLTPRASQQFVNVQDVGSGENSYRPMVTLSYFLNYGFAKLNPFWYHLTNVSLHAVNVFLVFILFGMIANNRYVGFFTAVLFAIHPVNAEAVCAIAAREDLLVCFFYLSAFLLYVLSGMREGRTRLFYYAGSLASFFFALFSKEMAMTFPFVILLFDYYSSHKDGFVKRIKARGAAYLGFFAVLLLYVMIRFFVLVVKGQGSPGFLGGNIFLHFLSIFQVLAHYLRWIFIPFDIHDVIPEDSSFVASGFFKPGVMLSVGAIVTLLGSALAYREKNKKIFFGIMFFFLSIIPASNIIPLDNYVAARYLYIPALGIFFIMAHVGVKVFGPFFSRAGIGVSVIARLFAVVVFSILCFFTSLRIAVWKDNLSFGLDLVRHYPANARLRCVLGTYYEEKGLLDKAVHEYVLSLRIRPDYGKAHLCLANVFHKKGQRLEAKLQYARAIRSNPKLWQSYYHLGNIFLAEGDYKKAEALYLKAMTLAPKLAVLYNNLGSIYFRLEDVEKARAVWLVGLKMNPRNEHLLKNLKSLEMTNPGYPGN